jgi:hypothetical protein
MDEVRSDKFTVNDDLETISFHDEAQPTLMLAWISDDAKSDRGSFFIADSESEKIFKVTPSLHDDGIRVILKVDSLHRDGVVEDSAMIISVF